MEITNEDYEKQIGRSYLNGYKACLLGMKEIREAKMNLHDAIEMAERYLLATAPVAPRIDWLG